MSDASQTPAGESTQPASGLALPWAAAMDDSDLHLFLGDLVSAAMGRWQSDPEVPDREVLAAVEKACAPWRTPGKGLRSDEDEQPEPFIPRTEREYWVDIANALNAANAAGMPVGIDIEGILTDHRMWAVVWNREQERWEVGGYEDDDLDPVLGAASAPPAPDFFQPGRTYCDSNGYRAPELVTHFRVEHVTRHPERGTLRAIGWMRNGAPGARWRGNFQDEGEFAGWTDITEDGDVS